MNSIVYCCRKVTEILIC